MYYRVFVSLCLQSDMKSQQQHPLAYAAQHQTEDWRTDDKNGLVAHKARVYEGGRERGASDRALWRGHSLLNNSCIVHPLQQLATRESNVPNNDTDIRLPCECKRWLGGANSRGQFDLKFSGKNSANFDKMIDVCRNISWWNFDC